MFPTFCESLKGVAAKNFPDPHISSVVPSLNSKAGSAPGLREKGMQSHNFVKDRRLKIRETWTAASKMKEFVILRILEINCMVWL